MFTDAINRIHSSFKFTRETSTNCLNFLDVNIHLDKGNLSVSLYTKPTNTHNYLHFNSAHSPSCKEAIPYGQFLRVKRNCSENEDYHTNSDILITYFTRRGYPEKLLENAKSQCDKISRTDILKTKKKTDNTIPQKIPMVLNYHPCNPPIMQAIRKHWPILQSSSSPELFTNKLFTAYRRPTNIKNKLVRAALTYPPTQGTQGRVVNNIHVHIPCIRHNCEI